jgi:hypothetical protein
MNDNIIYLRSDTHHYIKYDNTYDGPSIVGYSGGSLGAFNGNKYMMSWNTSNISINSPLNLNGYNVNYYLNTISGSLYNLPNIFKINNVYNYSYGTSPTVDLLTSSGNIYFNFGIPAGQIGATGPQGPQGSSADASSAKASTGLLGIMSGVGFAATGLSLGILQSEIAGLITQVSQLQTTVLTMQSTINYLSRYVQDLQEKCKYLDADRQNNPNYKVSTIGSQLRIGSHCNIGYLEDTGTAEITINGTLETYNNVKIRGNLEVWGSINYSNAPSTTDNPLIQFDF